MCVYTCIDIDIDIDIDIYIYIHTHICMCIYIYNDNSSNNNNNVCMYIYIYQHFSARVDDCSREALWRPTRLTPHRIGLDRTMSYDDMFYYVIEDYRGA